MPYIADCSGDGTGGGGGGCGDPTTGTSTMFTGAVAEALAGDYVPAVAGNIITDFSIRCTVDQGSAVRLEFSIDDGANWFRLKVGEAYADSPKNLYQLKIRASGTAVTSASYEILLNRGIV